MNQIKSGRCVIQMGHSNQHVFFFFFSLPFSCHLCQACGCGLIIEEPQAEITLISSFSFYYVLVWCLIIHPAPVLSAPELPLSTSCQSEETISIRAEVGMAGLRETAEWPRKGEEELATVHDSMLLSVSWGLMVSVVAVVWLTGWQLTPCSINVLISFQEKTKKTNLLTPNCT